MSTVKTTPTTAPRRTLSPTNNVLVARLVGLFGIRGELKCDSTPAGAPLITAGAEFSANLAGAVRSLRLATVRPHAGRLLVRVDGYDDASAAQTLVGAELFSDSASVKLAPGEYLDADLFGCELIGPGGEALGRVVEVAHYPAQDVLLVGTRRAIVPLVKAFIRDVDIAAKRISVDLPPGLLDDREAEEA